MGAVLAKKKRASVASRAVVPKRRSVLMGAVLAKKKRASVVSRAVVPKNAALTKKTPFPLPTPSYLTML
ncbi:hypothetical protein [Deinococcus sp.]|uniref:hypothetical protein n=1 Tax=Deinococcus sp. TaxID=47478 RepID=UPI003CC50A0E